MKNKEIITWLTDFNLSSTYCHLIKNNLLYLDNNLELIGDQSKITLGYSKGNVVGMIKSEHIGEEGEGKLVVWVPILRGVGIDIGGEG